MPGKIQQHDKIRELAFLCKKLQGMNDWGYGLHERA